MKKKCSFPECEKPARAAGLCSGHYSQKRDGRPIAPIKERPDVHGWLANHVNYEGDDCLIWPFAKSKGYGVINSLSGNKMVSRIMCAHRNGPPSVKSLHAAHTCGNGHLGCCNPKHLYWATKLENEHDKIKHGTTNQGERHGNAKLTDSKVRAIREFAYTCQGQTIADLFGISKTTVYKIIRGELWGHVQPWA